jgi:hypothetical protein
MPKKYIPQVFVAPFPESEASGRPMLVFAEMAEKLPLRAILEANHLVHIEADQWYPMQDALNVFKAIYESGGPNLDLVATGMKTMESFSLPVEANSIETTLPFFDQLSKVFSRNVPEDFGMPVVFTETGRAVLTNNTPIPYSAVYGFVYNILNTYKASDQTFLLKIISAENDIPTVFEIKWENTEDGVPG